MSMLRRHREKAQGFKPPAPPLPRTIDRAEHTTAVLQLTNGYERKLDKLKADFGLVGLECAKLSNANRRLEAQVAELEAKLAELTKAKEETPPVPKKSAPQAPSRKPKATKATKG